MKERLKTVLLFILVGSSIFLTRELWKESDSRASHTLESIESSTLSYPLINMISPNKYLIHFNKDKHTIFYDDLNNSLWKDSRPALKNIFESRDMAISKIDFNISDYNYKRSVVFYFSEKIATNILAKSLDIKKPNSLVDRIPYINYIYVYLGEGDKFIVLADEESHIKVEDPSIDTLALMDRVDKIETSGRHNYYYSLKEHFDLKKDLYVSYEMNNSLPPIYVENEIRTLSDKRRVELVERFFSKEIQYIKELVETGGSYIYEDSGSVLKLDINGSLEYFRPLDTSVKNRNLYESMKTTAEFFSRLTNLPAGIYLSKMEEIEENQSLGYRFTFKYRVRGMPIIMGKQEGSEPFEIEVFNNQVRSYRQFVRSDIEDYSSYPQEGPKLLTSFDLIEANYDFLLREYARHYKVKEPTNKELLEGIDNIYLAYFDPSLKDIESELIGVWAIVIGDTTYCFQASSGEIISQIGPRGD